MDHFQDDLVEPLELQAVNLLDSCSPAFPPVPYAGDAGLDLATTERVTVWPGHSANIPCGVAVALPPGTFGLIYTRSSTWTKRGLVVVSTVIDEGWRGELSTLVYRPVATGRFSDLQDGPDYTIPEGTRLAQLLVLPNLMSMIKVSTVDALPASERGTRGYGSSG